MASSNVIDEGKKLSKLNLENEDPFIMVAAIDFGTTFSGYAFSFTSAPDEIKMNKSWGESLGFQSYKTPTCVLVNGSSEFTAFGFEAEQKYSTLVESGEQGNYQLYRHFKMSLHKGVSRQTQIKSVSGECHNAMDIFVMSIRYLKDHLISSVAAQTTNPLEENMIRWVLTVPAIWKDEAKQFMREAAYNAGLIKKLNSRGLILALEPEAASIYCRSLDHFSGGYGVKSASFKSGTKYLVADVGGGTLDITAHEIILDGSLKEIHAVNGGAWGGTKVDENFIKLLKSILGEHFINTYQQECSHQWLNMMMLFEKAKKACKPDGESKIIIPLSWTMGRKYFQITKQDIEQTINKSETNGVSFANGSMVFSHQVVASLFEPVITQITDHLQNLMKLPKLKKCEYILLVGGFGECAFLHKAVHDHFKNKIALLVPSEAQMSVLKGAVIFGHNPMEIKFRIARKTYGVDSSTEFIHGFHRKRYLVQLGMNRQLCINIFSPFVQKGEEIQTGQIVKHYFCTILGHTRHTKFDLFAVDKKCPQNVVHYVDSPGFQKVGSVGVDTPIPGPFRSMTVEYTFGGTEIHVYVRDETSGITEDTTIDFLAD